MALIVDAEITGELILAEGDDADLVAAAEVILRRPVVRNRVEVATRSAAGEQKQDKDSFSNIASLGAEET